MNRFTLSFFTLFFVISAYSLSAYSQIPPEVMDAFQAYKTAKDNKDYKSAIKHGKTAWKEAEKSMGATKGTGDLAYNYGSLEARRGNPAKAIDALERSIELSELAKNKSHEIRLERELELVVAYESADKQIDARKRIDKALKFAGEHGLDKTVFVGELYFHKAKACNRLAGQYAAQYRRPEDRSGSRFNRVSDPEQHLAEKQKKCAKDAQAALDIFKLNPKQSQAAYVAGAANLVGFAYERDRKWLDAALIYQDVRDLIEPIYGRDNPLSAQTIGRWLNARNQLDWQGKLAEAEAAGLCQCWPVVTDHKTVRATKRVSADVPTQIISRRGSGFVIVNYDVSDAGQVENVKVVASWPEGMYDDASIETVKQWEFPSKTGDEPEEFRKNLVTPFSFIVYDRDSKRSL